MESAAGTQPEAHIDVEAGQRASRTADLVLTIVGLLLLLPAVLWLAWVSMWLGAVVSRCDGLPCNDSVAAGMVTAAFGPPAVWVVALAASIVVLARRRRASWIPPIAFLVAIGVQHAGAWFAQWAAGVSLTRAARAAPAAREARRSGHRPVLNRLDHGVRARRISTSSPRRC